MKFDVGHYFEDSLEETQDGPEGTHQGSRRVPGTPPRARQTPSWMPGGPPRCPLWPILPPWGKNPKYRGVSEFRRRLMAETYREEKAISGGHIPPGGSPPRRGDHRHRH